MATIKVTRKDLYNKIWADTLAGTAREYGMLPRLLKDVCIEYKIPTPSSTYWSKVNYGKDVEKTPLPEPDSNPTITLSPDQGKTAEKATYKTKNEQILDDFVSAKDRERKIRDGIRKARTGRYVIDFSAEPSTWTRDLELLAEIFPVAQPTHSTRDIILNTRQHQRIADLPYDKRDSIPFRVQPKEWLDIKTSKETFARALAIFNSLISIFEALGLPIESKEGHTTVKVNGFSIQIFITEKKNRVPAEQSRISTYDYIYSGILRVTVVRRLSYQNTVIEDTPHTKLEEKIDKVVAKVLEAMMDELEWKEKKRKMEEERLRQEEIRRLERLKAQELEENKEAERNRLRRLHDHVQRHTLARQYAAVARQLAETDETAQSELQKAFARELEYFSQLLDPTQPNPPGSLLTEKDITDMAIELLYGENE